MAGLKVHVGCGTVGLPGFVNVDVRRTEVVDRIGHAGDLSAFQTGSVQTLYCHAVLEHVYAAQLLLVLREWRRVLNPSGAAICLALPNFAAVANQYVNRGVGCQGEVFNLFEAYRQTHGEPEHASTVDWKRFSPMKRANSAPPGWVPQIHKCLFDPDFVSALLIESGFSATIFTYPYPGEKPVINIGFVARPLQSTPLRELNGVDVRGILDQIPGISRVIDRNTIEIITPGETGTAMVRWCKEMEEKTPRPLEGYKRVARGLGRALRSLKR